MELFRCSERDSQSFSSRRGFFRPEFFREGRCGLLFFIRRSVFSRAMNDSPDMGDCVKIS